MIHHVFANRSNIGDWLSAKGIQQLLQPCEVKEYLCDEPFVEQTLSELAALDDGELVVVGGGGLLMDYFAPLWEGLCKLAPRLRICIWGVGYCDLKFALSHPPVDAVRHVIRSATLCVVRDDLTRGYLACGLRPAVPCPSMVVVNSLPRGQAVLHVDNFDNAGADAYELMDGVCRDYATRFDRPFLKTNNRIERPLESAMAQRLALYERADVVVSSALHGCVIAVAMGRPVIAVSGDRKIEAFMGMAGLQGWVLDTADVGALPILLEKLPAQQQDPRFVAQVRLQNQQVADCIKRHAAGRPGRTAGTSGLVALQAQR